MQAIGLTRPGLSRIGAPAGLSLVPGAVAYWDCTQVVGQVLPDLSGNGNHATLGSTAGADTNDPTAGPIGLTFDGDDRVNCGLPNRIFAAPGSPFSVVIAHSAVSDGTIIARCGAGAVGTRQFQYYLSGASTLSINLRGTITAVYSGAATLASPHAITITWDGTTATAYADGTPIPLGVGAAVEEATESLLIGARTSAAPAGGLGGRIHAAAVYPVGLSAAQVAQIHRYLTAKFAPLGVALP
jgi:hypothetical protein